MINIPNILTTLRFLLIPVFVHVYMFSDLENASLVAAAVLAVAYVTDILDGYIARKYNQITKFGRFMDPLADKLFQICALICIVIKHNSVFLLCTAIFICAKELLLIIGGIFLYNSAKEKVVIANWFGKIASFLNIFCIFVILVFTTNQIWYIITLILLVVFNSMAFISYYRSLRKQ